MKRQFRKGTCFKFYKRNSSAGTIVLIHGLGLNLEVWNWQIPFYSDYNVLVYDLRGHGDSTKARSKPSLSDFVNQLDDLFNYLQIRRAILIGFSLGAMIARKFSIEFSHKVKKLVMLNSPNKQSASEKEEVVKRSKLVLNKGAAVTADAAIERWYTNSFRTKNKQMINLTKFWIQANESITYSMIYPILYYGSLELHGNFCNVPTLILTCDQDFANGPVSTHKIAKYFPNSTVVILKGLRHMALIESPDTVNHEVQKFLNS